jgi:hypothetical protein
MAILLNDVDQQTTKGNLRVHPIMFLQWRHSVGYIEAKDIAVDLGNKTLKNSLTAINRGW